MKIVEPHVQILTPIDRDFVYKHIESCGRTCYKSTPTDTSAEKFIRGIIKSGHESVLEHFSFSVKMLCDVGVYKDLTRHRHASFSIESTRFCNYSKDKFGKEITFIQPCNMYYKSPEFGIWADAMQYIEDSYNSMAAMGATADQLRMLLPHSTAAEVCMTANIREWRHILKLRTAKAVHPAVRQIMLQLLKQLKELIPVFFEDIGDDD